MLLKMEKIKEILKKNYSYLRLLRYISVYAKSMLSLASIYS